MRYCILCDKPMCTSLHSIWIDGKNYNLHVKCSPRVMANMLRIKRNIKFPIKGSLNYKEDEKMTLSVYEIQCSKCHRCLNGITKRRVRTTILCHNCFQEELTSPKTSKEKQK